MKNPRCAGKRRMWRGHTLGTYKCGRVARYVFQSYVGTCTTHYVCADAECLASITHGYRAMNMRELQG